MSEFATADVLIQVSYFVTALLFIMGLKRMSSPVFCITGATALAWVQPLK